jgi:DNA-binding transcriptional regulator YiaG
VSLLGGFAASTSAGGPMSNPRFCWVVVAGTLSLSGTATALPSAQNATAPLRTTSGVEFGLRSAEAAVSELRRLSGLTWEQLARLFSVSRRTLHFWASGKVMNAANEERVHRVLALVRRIDRGTASENRAALLQPTLDGPRPVDLLAAGRYDDAFAALGHGRGRATMPRAPLHVSPEPLAAAPTPAELVAARHNREHVEVGRSRPAKIGRARKS